MESDTSGNAELFDQYWRYVPEEELTPRSVDELRAAVTEHRELAARRLPGEVRLRVSPGATPLISVVEIVTDDMPFLVDSVTNELSRLGAEIRLLVHPQVTVRRDAVGALQQLLPTADPDQAGTGTVVESWMRIEVDRAYEPAFEQALLTHLRRVLTDVRESVEDWSKMRNKALVIADELRAADLPVPDKDVSDSWNLLRWLVDDHFTFLGYREYRLVRREDGEYLQAVLGTGLGILRSDQAEPRNINQLPAEVRERLLEPRLLMITKANSRSTVHRADYMDYIGLKIFDASGVVVGERRFLGLFSTSAYFESVRKLPVTSRKVEEVIRRSGLNLRSYSGRHLMYILETYPRDELFQIRTDELYETVMGVLRLSGRRQLRLFVRHDAYGRFVSCLLYLPRDRYNTRIRIKIQDLLMTALNGIGVDYTARVSEGMLARVRFIVRVAPQASVGPIDTAALQAKLVEITRLWEEDFADALAEQLSPAQAYSMRRVYAEAFGDGYKAERSAVTAVADVIRLEALTEPGAVDVQLERDSAIDTDDELRFTIYQRGDGMPLSEVLPVLQSLGVRVLHEQPYRVTPADRDPMWVYDYGLALPPGTEAKLDVATVGRAVEAAFLACWRGEAEIDGFNGLVLAAGLTWEQIVVLRAYQRYLRQAGIRYSQAYIDGTLRKHPSLTRLLIGLFDARFNPAFGGDAEAVASERLAALHTALDGVASLDEDRIIRAFLAAITATLRTNHYQRDAAGARRPHLALKLDPASIGGLPEPLPKFEIFVYSPRMEGVHMRFGSVARGGLRWSDRREDFRTEILGLVKAQIVKNVIIVPTGSKGGFVLKRPPAVGGREALQTEGVACYQSFIAGLLDVTDNLVANKVVPPTEVVRHDGDDPYLVVAADKGTATFSDIANAAAESRGFWLGDAFASGGSHGYDHKKMGITARGAWESVKRHFRQLGVDTQTQDFTVVGIGDMSGDVFGNGMLLSEHIRLVAAFDHRHIFIDPTPDAASSFAERSRIFQLPVSSWNDYDRALISFGGGVWPRTAKSIPLSPQVRVALGIADDIAALTPSELISAILRAPVDLLWNGGIGTYVKAASESDDSVGDKSNDAVRINGGELRCTVVGEGGNLGLTQLGRIEYAFAGGRINTDAIDNSAGVDTSDHEVNMKILFNLAEVDHGQRNELLTELTEEVARLVLCDNYAQNHALMVGGYLAPKMLSVHRRLMTELEQLGLLDRELEYLPSDEDCAERELAGGALTAPELAVLLAYVKIAVKEEVLASSLPDDPWCDQLLIDYFPAALRERFASTMLDHPLRREIIATRIVNEVVDRGGITFVYRAVEETGASVVDVVRAYLVTREVFKLPALWAANEALDNKASSDAQIAVLGKLRRVLDRGVRWLLQSRGGSLDVGAEIVRLGPGLAELLPRVPELAVGEEAEALDRYVRRLTDLGVPSDVAIPAAATLHGFGLLDVVEAAAQRGLPPVPVAQVYFTVSDRFRMDELLLRVTELPRDTRWNALARMALRYDIYAVLAGVTAEVLDRAGARANTVAAGQLVDEWAAASQIRIERVEHTLQMLLGDTKTDLATLSVALRQLRSLVSPR